MFITKQVCTTRNYDLSFWHQKNKEIIFLLKKKNFQNMTIKYMSHGESTCVIEKLSYVTWNYANLPH